MIIEPKLGERARSARRVTSCDQPVNLEAKVRGVHAVQSRELALKVLHQQLLGSVDPGNAPPCKRGRRKRILHNQTSGCAALAQLSVQRIHFIANMVKATAPAQEFV